MILNILDIATASGAVANVAGWKNRHYINLKGANRSLAGDRNLKIWVRGDTLTIEGAKGCRSGAFRASLADLIDALVAAGAVRHGYGDTIEATYTL